jgi:hypothetical protein
MVVSGVGWTGYSPAINETPGSSLKRGNVIIINADNIKGRTLNEWLEFRENTTFNLKTNAESAAKYSIKMNFTVPGKASTNADTLKYFLIHESAHIIATALPYVHPDYDKYHNSEIPVSEFEKPYEPGQTGFPFLQTTWLPQLVQHADGSEATYKLLRMAPLDMIQIFQSKPVKFYGTDEAKKFNLQESVKIYNGLNETCFASLYGTVDFAEDFAETVVHYFMTYRDHYQYSSKVVKKSFFGSGQIRAEFDSPLWKRQECLPKLNYMKTLFEIEK